MTAGKHRKVSITRKKPKRSNLHLAMVIAGMVIAVVTAMGRIDGWLHLALPALPGVPSIFVELFDRVWFREDLLENVIEQVLPK